MNSKRKKVALLAFLLTGAFAAGAAASNGIERVDAFLRPDFKLIVDGKTAQLNNPILVYNDTSYLPIREISGLLGADVNWNNSSYTAYINSRFEGQPAQPEDSTDFQEIEMKNPTPMYMKYLGREYGLMSFYGDMSMYYRVIDLNRMGVDTGGILKYREKNTHELYITQQDAEKLWKERPENRPRNGTITSGINDTKTKEFLQTMVTEIQPFQFESYPYTVFSPFASVFFIDTIDDHPGNFAMYFWNQQGKVGVIMVKIEKDANDNWVRRSFSIIDLEYRHKYFSDNNK